jgi:hypothetical protein
MADDISRDFFLQKSVLNPTTQSTKKNLAKFYNESQPYYAYNRITDSPKLSFVLSGVFPF